MENIIKKTELCIVQPLPHHGDSCRSTDHREEEDCTIDGASCDLLVQKNSKKQSDDDTERNFNDCILNRVPERLPCFSSRNDLLIVCETDKNVSLAEVTGLAEGLINRVEERVEIKNNKAEHRREYESVTPCRFTLLGRCHFLFHEFPFR